MSYINTIGTALPAYRHRQEDIELYMRKALQPSADIQRKLHLLYARSGIAFRHSVLPDYSGAAAHPFFHTGEPPAVEQRMELFFEHAPGLAKKAILDCLDVPDLPHITHLITVSCTGMAAPGIDIALVQLLGLPNDIYRTSVNFMGCYGAFHALKIADTICRSSPHAKVLIVCVELCTIHFQPLADEDNLMANLLFADGAAAAVVSNEPKGLEITAYHSLLAPAGIHDMSWQLSHTGFLMRLTSYIPALLEKHIAPLLHATLKKTGWSRSEVQHWAIHPGGRKIIETIAQELSLTAAETAPSTKVLREYGNMSSATILFVLREMLEQEVTGNIFACGFGPGLTMETLLLRR